MNPTLNLAECQAFLDSCDAQTRRRGESYYRDGAVVQVACARPGECYTAIVRGSLDYTVNLLAGVDLGWEAECDCPVGIDCKHGYAAMRAVMANAHKFIGATVAAPAGPPSKPRSQDLPPPPEPPTSASPLLDRLEAAGGGKLKANQRAYVRSIQSLFSTLQQWGRQLTPYDLRLLAPDIRDYGWQALELWPEKPRDEHEFWHYIAWELRRRRVSWPVFMDAVTDLDKFAPKMQRWERRKEVQVWQQKLAGIQFTAGPGAVETPVDFRLCFQRAAAELHWKERPDQDFKPLKSAQLKRLLRSHEDGSLALVPAVMPLWLSFYKPWDHHSMLHLDYDNADAVKLLNRAFRCGVPGDHFVNAAGLPLERPTDALRYDLSPAQSEDENYQLRLVLPDGSAPEILLTLPGQPTFYLTPNAALHGPPPHGLGEEGTVSIPAPALESAPGLTLLDRLGLEPPPRLAQRTRRVVVKVTITCALNTPYPGATADTLSIGVAAEQEDGPSEIFGASGWFAPAATKPANKATAAKDGLIPVLDRSAQTHFPALLESLNAKWEYYNNSWRVRVTKSFPELFVPWLQGLPSHLEVLLDKELATLRAAPLSGSVRLDVEEAGVDWFDLKVVLDVTDTELTPEELKLLLNARGKFVRLGKKGWRRLQFNLTEEDDDRLARLGLDAKDFSAEPQRLHALQLADQAARKFLPEEQVARIERRADELKARVSPAVPEGISATLRPYQVDGFHFLAYLTANRFGGVLADDMGLGKTLQTLTWLAWLRAETQNAKPKTRPVPSLVVCPKSVMDNWNSEAARFLPGLRVCLWRGEDFAAFAAAAREADLLVINYSQLRGLSPEIAKVQWHVAILDEAQYIKNPDSQTAQSARALKAEHRLALTGTPIENRLLDLWSILAYAMPGVLGNRSQFTKRFNAQDDPFARRRLAARVRPFLLRRTKGQVAKDLPDRTEEDLLCEMEGQQKTLYRAEFKRAQQLLLRVQTQQDLNEQRFNFLTSLLRLRQICCHPALVDAKLAKTEAAKVSALIDLLEPIMEEGHKVLVFSQFVTMLDLLRETVEERKWPHFYLAGDTENRGELVSEFQSAQGGAVFLISLKAGGFGLNLTAASYVVLFDPWWNPAVESQAIDRTHRIGQTSKVIAYRLLMKDSIEQKIRQLQKTKAALAEDVLGEETFAKALTLDDLKYLFAEE